MSKGAVELAGVPLLSHGFRPFFLGASLWAALAMMLWVGLMSGHWAFATRYGIIAWHAHEFLFGYVSGVLTGFLLTAIPNWTGRLPLRSGTLLALFTCWVAGRIALLASDSIGAIAAAAVDALFLFALVAVISREIIAGRNWRNLRVAVLVLDYGTRLAIAAVIGLIMLVGGRLTPSFTRNWLVRQGASALPASFDRWDAAALIIAGTALVAWILAPGSIGTAVLLLAAAIAQAARLSRWAGASTWPEPLVLALHCGYAFVPLGFALVGISVMSPEVIPASDALHAWTTGAMGVMTLAVMTRATLGHTGRNLTAAPATQFIYLAVILAAVARLLAPAVPSLYIAVLTVAAALWALAFGAFALAFGPMLVGPPKAS